MNVRIVTKWHGAAFQAKVHKQQGTNLKAAGEHLRDAIVQDITKLQGSNSPPLHSRPGDPPYKITGDLAASFFAFTDTVALIAQVGTPLEYGRYLEMGTLMMAPRPHIRANLYGNVLLPFVLCKPI